MRNIKTIYIILPILLFILLAFFIVFEKTSIIDELVYNQSIKYMSPNFTHIIKVITSVGDTISIIAICLILLIIKKTRRNYGVPISIGVIISTLVNMFLKNIFSRERPDILRLIDIDDYSFPSGHAMISATLYTLIILYTMKYAKSKRIKVIVAILCSLLTLLIGFSRIYLGVHYFGDIMGGWLLGFAIALIIFKIDEYYKKKSK